MDPLHRGIIEQYIDQLIEEDNLKIDYEIFEGFKRNNLIDSTESAMFAQIFARVCANFRLLNLDLSDVDKLPTEKDLVELTELFLSRAFKIKSRIREICNL